MVIKHKLSIKNKYLIDFNLNYFDVARANIQFSFFPNKPVPILTLSPDSIQGFFFLNFFVYSVGGVPHIFPNYSSWNNN